MQVQASMHMRMGSHKGGRCTRTTAFGTGFSLMIDEAGPSSLGLSMTWVELEVAAAKALTPSQ